MNVPRSTNKLKSALRSSEFIAKVYIQRAISLFTLTFISVTEREVRRGIINANDTEKHCLAYIRHIQHMDLSAVNSVRNFVDMIGNVVDTEADSLLSILREELLPAKLIDSNIARFIVDWSGDQGLDVGTHSEYLQQFCEVFDR